MANRFAPYKARYLTREPRTLVLHWISTGTTGEQELANGATYGSNGPFNKGIVNVSVSGTGITAINLGTSASQQDQYAHFAGMDFATDDPDTIHGEFTNVECNATSDPNITFQVTDTDDADKDIGDGNEVWVRLHFLDSADA